MIYEHLAKILQDAGLGTIGETIFIHEMEADVTKGIMLRGPLDGIPHNWYIPGFHCGEIQAIVRDTAQVTGAAKARQVEQKLTMFRARFQPTTIAGVEVGAMTVQQMLPLTMPIRYPRSEGRGIEWSLNFKCAFTLPD